MNKINVIVGCIDTIRTKNLYQLKGLEWDCNFFVLTTDSHKNSLRITGGAENVEVFISNPKWVKSSILLQLVKILLKRKIHIAEIYPHGVLDLLVAIILKLRKVPIVIIARGAENLYIKKILSFRDRVAFMLTYKLCDYVIYKEPYMRDLIIKMKVKNYWMLPNAVKIPERIRQGRRNRCNFLYLNSIRYCRYPEVALKAFLKICEELKLGRNSEIRLVIVGLKGEKARGIEKDKEDFLHSAIAGKDVPVELHSWTETPEQYLDNTDVFLLPADVVFLNYSLLEAMSRGVPAIVQDVYGSDKIISHDIDGYTLPLNEELWADYMMRLISDFELRNRLGSAAREKIINQFSIERYLRDYKGIYGRIMQLEAEQKGNKWSIRP